MSKHTPAWCTGPLVIGALQICQPSAVFTDIILDAFFVWQFIRHPKSDIYKTPWIYLFTGYMLMSTTSILQRTIFPCDTTTSGPAGGFFSKVLWEALMVGGYYMVAQYGIAGALNDLGWIDWTKRKTQVFNVYITIFVSTYQFFNEFFPFRSKKTAEVLFAVPALAVFGGIIVTNVLLAVYVCRNRLHAHKLLVVALITLSGSNMLGLTSFFWRGGNECWYYVIEAACTMALWWYVLQSRLLADTLKNTNNPTMRRDIRDDQEPTDPTVSKTGHYVPITLDPEEELEEKYNRSCVDSELFQRLFVRGPYNIRIPKIDLSNPRSYKGGRIDPFTTFCDRQFKKLAYHLPKFLSPNILTISGLIISFLGELPAAIYIWRDYLSNGSGLGYQFFTLPRYMYVLIIIGVEMDWVLDAMDGEYARITGQQSCARHVFDHVTDVLQRIFTPIVCTALLPIRDMPLAYFIPVLTVMSELALFIPFARYYITGQFNLCLGLRLTSHSLNIYLLVCAIAGGQVWEGKAAFTFFCIWFGAIFLLVIYEILEHLYESIKSEFSWGEIIHLFFTPVMILNLLCFTFVTGLARREPLGISFILGVTFCAYTNHVMTQQHVQRVPALTPIELWISWVGMIGSAMINSSNTSITAVLTTAFALSLSYISTTHLLLSELKTLPNGKTFSIFLKKEKREAAGTTSLQQRHDDKAAPFVLNNSPPAHSG